MSCRDPEQPRREESQSVEILMSAIKSLAVERVRHLLESGEVTLDNADNVPLCVACQLNSVEIVKILLKHGADVNEGSGFVNDYYDLQSRSIMKPIHCACNGGGERTEVVKCLIDQGCDLDAGDEWKNTPLHFACLSQNVSLVHLLLDAGARVHKENCKYETPLISASSDSRNVELIKILLDAGSDPTALGCESMRSCIQYDLPQGVTLLYKASRSSVYDIGSQMARLRLMSQRTDLQGEDFIFDEDIAGDNVGIPPLHMACSSPFGDPFESVRTLLILGADLHEKDLCNFNCLQHACSRLNVKTVHILIDFGLNPSDHSWHKLWKAFPPITIQNADNYLNMLNLLVLSGFKIDEESTKMFTGAFEASDLPEKKTKCLLNLLTTSRTVPQSLQSISRMKIRHSLRANIEEKIGQLEDSIPLVVLDYLRLLNFWNHHFMC